jgi:hypothetical protein
MKSFMTMKPNLQRISASLGNWHQVKQSICLPEKIANKRNHCLFQGYGSRHIHDTFRVLDLKKKSVMLIRMLNV